MTQETDTYTAAAESGAVIKRRSWRERAWLVLRKAPLTAWFGMATVLAYFCVALFAPIVAPYGEAEVFGEPPLGGPG